jgi:hypothetical protein
MDALLGAIGPRTRRPEVDQIMRTFFEADPSFSRGQPNQGALKSARAPPWLQPRFTSFRPKLELRLNPRVSFLS